MGYILSEPLNVHIGNGNPSLITWEQFKKGVETDRDWKYDEETKTFYELHGGYRVDIHKRNVIMIAAMCGYYEDMSEYLE